MNNAVTPNDMPNGTPNVDPVRAKRAKVAKYTLLANRIGYLFFALAISTFIIGFAISFNGAVSAIVIGYAVKAAERDDRERGL